MFTWMKEWNQMNKTMTITTTPTTTNNNNTVKDINKQSTYEDAHQDSVYHLHYKI